VIPVPERPVYVYRLAVTYPPHSREYGWEPPGWGTSESEAYRDGYMPDDPGEFRWPENRPCLSLGTAKRRADLFRSYGAKAEIIRSERVTWGEPDAG
jgi:hypothetical protein